jgi:hypothetical protein
MPNFYAVMPMKRAKKKGFAEESAKKPEMARLVREHGANHGDAIMTLTKLSADEKEKSSS